MVSSVGSTVVGSTLTASRSQTALAYSLRFRRCSATRPGCGGRAAAELSRDVSMKCTKEWIWSEGGCFCPGGGIRRPRSLTMAFSQVSASEPISFGVIVSKAMLPAQSSALWHFSQYCLSMGQFWAAPGGPFWGTSEPAASADFAAGCAWAGAPVECAGAAVCTEDAAGACAGAADGAGVAVGAGAGSVAASPRFQTSHAAAAATLIRAVSVLLIPLSPQ